MDFWSVIPGVVESAAAVYLTVRHKDVVQAFRSNWERLAAHGQSPPGEKRIAYQAWAITAFIYATGIGLIIYGLAY